MELQVSFTSQGANVFGVLHLPEETPAPGLIMCHGFTGHKAEAHRLFVEAARDFSDHGLAVLRFDFRGSGDSEGDFADMTVSGEIADAAAALEFLASRPEAVAERLGVLGLSLGGCVSACVAGREPGVRALVLWAAVAHLERLTESLASEFRGGKVVDRQGWAIGRALLDDVSDIEPLREVARYAGPSLVVHGSQDDAVPPSDAADYRVALGGRCRVHCVEGADHVFSGLAWKREAIELSRAFLVEALGARA